MSTSRRNFLRNSTMVALAAGVPLGIAERIAAASAPGTSSAESVLTKAAFERALNTKFLINANRSKVSVKLVDVQDLGSESSGRREAFALTFRGDDLKSLNQNTYVIEHDQLGTFSFLLVPMKRDNKDRPRYEAVINRLH
ncbi:MAG TPA: twin-arginine translocation signal domain-containing protein [Pyrinomonadaceae bacterium]